MTKKISILSLHLGYGGIEKSIVSLANTLCSKYDVEIACCYKLYENSVFSINDKVKVKYLNGNLKPNRDKFKAAVKSKNIFKIIREGLFAVKVLFCRKKSMVKYLLKTNADVIISTRDIFNYWLSDYGKDNVLKIGWEHNHFHNDLRYATKIVRSAKKLDYLVLVSSELQKFYSKELQKSNCMCIYIPNSIEKIPSKLATLTEKNLISVGRLSKEKGFLDLLKIFKKILLNYPDWHLNIVGDGNERYVLEEYIVKNNLNSNVTLHGFQNKDYIDELLHKSSIYIMTSYTESFGIVLIEAMSHGVPCIAFDSAEGAREIISSGRNGFLIKNRNFDVMIQKVSDLIDNTEERIKIGKEAHESVKKYASDKIVDEWIKLIEESEVYE